MTPEQFWSKADVRGLDECWPWQDYVGKNGYGLVTWAGKTQYAHRVAYQLVWPEGSRFALRPGEVVDHVAHRGCTRKDCVNPAHLQAVSQLVNVLRGRSATHIHGVCKKGHDLSIVGTYEHGARCAECTRIDHRERYATKRAAKAGER